MAVVKFTLPLGTWDNMMTIIDSMIVEGDSETSDRFMEIGKELKSTSVLMNDKDVVVFRMASDAIMEIFKAMFGTGDTELFSIHAECLLDDREREKKRYEEEQAKHKAYVELVEACVKKYALETTLTSKEIAEAINKNDLQEGMRPITYQSIMKRVSAYRKAVK